MEGAWKRAGGKYLVSLRRVGYSGRENGENHIELITDRPLQVN